MTATIIDGKQLAATLREAIAARAAALKRDYGIVPGLAAVLVGDNAASATYVRMKRKACEEVGIMSVGVDLPADISQTELEDQIRVLNARPDIHGILVQLPLPAHLDESKILALVGLDKDVDGFHPVNIGLLAQKGRDPYFISATPSGVMELLKAAGAVLAGANAVVLGRSNIVGMPVALLLMRADATVTICHSRTRDLPAVIRRADILIAAVGRARMVQPDWIKPGAIVIDVGTNRVDDPTTKSGYRLVGDVDFEGALGVAGVITPVPGGVGPLTITMLLQNTVTAAERMTGSR